MKIFAEDGANVLPIAVPLICKCNFKIYSKVIEFKIIFCKINFQKLQNVFVRSFSVRKFFHTFLNSLYTRISLNVSVEAVNVKSKYESIGRNLETAHFLNEIIGISEVA